MPVLFLEVAAAREEPGADLDAATLPSRGITTSWCPLRAGRAGEEACGVEVHRRRAASCEVTGAATPASPAAPGSQGLVGSLPAPGYPGLQLPGPPRPQSCLRWVALAAGALTSSGPPGWP